MRFSTTRFFTDQFLRSYRMSRIREVLLLACRMALFALLGFAIAQPLLSTPATAAFHGGGPRGVVLVLDDSASMGYTEDGATLLDRAAPPPAKSSRTFGPATAPRSSWRATGRTARRNFSRVRRPGWKTCSRRSTA